MSDQQEAITGSILGKLKVTCRFSAARGVGTSKPCVVQGSTVFLLGLAQESDESV